MLLRAFFAILASTATLLALANVAAASGVMHYQPEVPKHLRNH